MNKKVKKMNNKMSELPTKEDLNRYDEKMNDDYSNDLMKKHEKSCESIFKMAKTSIQKVIQEEKNFIDKKDIPFFYTTQMMSQTVEGCLSFYKLRHSLQELGIETKVVEKFGRTEDQIEFNPVSKTLTFIHHYPHLRKTGFFH